MTFYSQYRQDEILNATVFKNFKRGVFVDVGAHDGISLNNTLYFENEHNWTGINIEPIPHVFDQCKINRPNCVNVCCAVDREEGEKFFRVNRGYTEMLSGLVDHLCEKHIQRTELENSQHHGTSELIVVPTKPLRNIFREHQLSKINFLSVDVEGAEQAVIESIDFEEVSIDVIMFENNYPENSNSLMKYLENHGFVQFQSGIADIFMIHKDSDFLKDNEELLNSKSRITKKKVAIYTCIYGGYESNLRNFAEMQRASVLELDFFCFTDNQSVINAGQNWKIIQFEPCKELCTCSESHYDTLGKMHNVVLIRSRPDQIECLKKYDACVYVDGNCVINDVCFFENMLKNELGSPKLMISKHPERNCLYAEAQVSMQMTKYNNTDLKKQIDGYRLQNYPENNGLFWNGLMVYVDHTSPKFQAFYDLWSKELLDYVVCDKKCYHSQGQVSLPFVLWKLSNSDALKDMPKLKILESIYSHNINNPIFIVEHGQ